MHRQRRWIFEFGRRLYRQMSIHEHLQWMKFWLYRQMSIHEHLQWMKFFEGALYKM